MTPLFLDFLYPYFDFELCQNSRLSLTFVKNFFKNCIRSPCIDACVFIKTLCAHVDQEDWNIGEWEGREQSLISGCSGCRRATGTKFDYIQLAKFALHWLYVGVILGTSLFCIRQIALSHHHVHINSTVSRWHVTVICDDCAVGWEVDSYSIGCRFDSPLVLWRPLLLLMKILKVHSSKLLAKL